MDIVEIINAIDAVDHSRANRFHPHDQTLNQLLGELDGFDSSKGVVILAATNRPEILDKALLRAGRFDRRIIVDKPNLQGRLDTLKVHTRKIKLSEDVDLRKIAQATAGAVGADLANLVNEAALRAVRQGRKAVNQEDLLVSFEVVIAGTEKKNTVLTDTEKRLVAYHEVGHALIAALEKHSQPVSKITIVPHTTGALGYTMQMPEEEKYITSKEELLTELDPDRYMVVLDHEPHDYEAQEQSGVDLVLSGHTHGGWLFPATVLSRYSGPDDKVYGMEKRSDTTFIVTSGISDWNLKFKTGCIAEWVMVTVE